MSTRIHFFILVLVLITTLSFNGVAPQTQELDQKAHRASTHGGPYVGLMKRSGTSGRVLEQTQDNLEDMIKANPKPRVVGHSQLKTNWRYQPDVGEEYDIEGREAILSKKIRLKPKRGNPANKATSPVPAPKV
ncbi:hypothetical protein HanIR_Chr02g0062271 [Helianthus annuus]|nr:hypothetical protein HanIR_Chr02g0062271 [Helianthus annuus]